jgi:hypothetical protein
MDVMACQALPLPDRLMYNTLRKYCGLFLVTPITERGVGFLKQSLETGNVWIVTRTTLVLGNRLMHYFASEVSPFVTFETGRFGKTGRNRTNGQDNY